MYGRDYRLGYGLTVAQGGALHVELGVDAHRRESPRRGPTWTRGARRTAPSPACVVNDRLRYRPAFRVPPTVLRAGFLRLVLVDGHNVPLGLVRVQFGRC